MSEEADSGRQFEQKMPQSSGMTSVGRAGRGLKSWQWRAILLGAIFVIGFGLSAWLMPSLRSRIPVLDYILPLPPQQAGQVATLQSKVSTLQQQLSSLERRNTAQDEAIATLRRQSDGVSAQISDLEGRITQLTGMSADETSGPKGARRPVASGALNGRLEMLASRVAQLEAAFVPLSRRAQAESDAHNKAAALEKQVTGLTQRVSALEAFAAVDRQGSILGLTLAQLHSAIDSGRPFQTTLGLLLDLIPQSGLKQDEGINDALNTLQNYAPEGVPTREQLHHRFERMATAVIRAGEVPVDASWLGRAWGYIKGLVVIRQRGDVKGNSPAAILARAEFSLSEDDLDDALTQLEALKGNAAEAAKPWIESAEARQDVDAAIEQLSSLLEQQASKTPASAGEPAAPGQKPAAATQQGAH